MHRNAEFDTDSDARADHGNATYQQNQIEKQQQVFDYFSTRT